MCVYIGVYICMQLHREEEIGLFITDYKISTSFELGGVLYLQLDFGVLFCFVFQVFCVMELPSYFFIHPSACWTLGPELGFAVSTQICRKLIQKVLNTEAHLKAIAKTHGKYVLSFKTL